MAHTLRRPTLALAASLVFLASACGGEDPPEALPLIEAITTSTVDTLPATTVDLDAPTAELTPQQQTLLDGCASVIEEATADLDPADPDYAGKVMGAVMGDDSVAMNACGALLEPDSGLSRDVIISFMIEHLPPELLGALGQAASSGDLPEGLEDSGGDPAVAVDPGVSGPD